MITSEAYEYAESGQTNRTVAGKKIQKAPPVQRIYVLSSAFVESAISRSRIRFAMYCYSRDLR